MYHDYHMAEYNSNMHVVFCRLNRFCYGPPIPCDWLVDWW